MLEIGTEIMEKRHTTPGYHTIHRIDDIRTLADGTKMYRAYPYQVYATEEKILQDFDLLSEPELDKTEDAAQ